MQFTYDDNMPWPSLADGDGLSLIHMNPPPGYLRHANAANWRSSATSGGNPGTSDTRPAPANPNDDDDGDGFSNLLEHVMGENTPFSAVDQRGGSVLLTWTQRPGGNAARIIVESSTDLITWLELTASGTQTEYFSSGLIQHSARHPTPVGARIYYRARVHPAP